MKKPFFVMLYAQSYESAFPLVSENDEVVFFATEEDAREAAEENFIGSKIGYEVMDMERTAC